MPGSRPDTRSSLAPVGPSDMAEAHLERAVDIANELRLEAMGAWSAVLNGVAVCRFSGPEPLQASVKELEGRAVALRDAVRLLRGGGDALAIVGQLREQWSESPGSGKSWERYRDGGLAALAELLEALA